MNIWNAAARILRLSEVWGGSLSYVDLQELILFQWHFRNKLVTYFQYHLIDSTAGLRSLETRAKIKNVTLLLQIPASVFGPLWAGFPQLTQLARVALIVSNSFPEQSFLITLLAQLCTEFHPPDSQPFFLAQGYSAPSSTWSQNARRFRLHTRESTCQLRFCSSSKHFGVYCPSPI